MALHVGLTQKQIIAGIIGLSGCLLPLTPVPARLSRCIVAHGTADKVIPFDLALKLYERDGFRDKREVALYKVYGMDHCIYPEVITIMKKFMDDRLKGNPK